MQCEEEKGQSLLWLLPPVVQFNLNKECFGVLHFRLMDKWCQYPYNYHMLVLVVNHSSTYGKWRDSSQLLCESSGLPWVKTFSLSLLNKYRDVIALPGESLSASDKTKHHIRSFGSHPRPSVHLVRGKLLIKEMLEQGVIQHSWSPWNAPLFLVLEKDEQFRPVIDFWKVNEVTEDDKCPLPILSDLLMSSGQGNNTFSSLDLLSGFW